MRGPPKGGTPNNKKSQTLKNQAFGNQNSLLCLLVRKLRSFDNFAALNTAGTSLDTPVTAGGKFYTHRLKIRIEPSPGLVVSVRYVVSKLRTFSAYVAAFSHNECLRITG